jgi:hypothetical protein
VRRMAKWLKDGHGWCSPRRRTRRGCSFGIPARQPRSGQSERMRGKWGGGGFSWHAPCKQKGGTGEIFWPKGDRCLFNGGAAWSSGGYGGLGRGAGAVWVAWSIGSGLSVVGASLLQERAWPTPNRRGADQ